jgi:2-dehydro-3-deoxyphosphogluconate aldolase / (4S)-4-hydroxy-2-oxoglutarate aldolase
VHRWTTCAAIAETRCIAIVRASGAEEAISTGGVLAEAGIKVLEVAYTTPGAATAIARLRAAYPAATVGAGTVLDAAAAYTAIEAGARFLVSPVIAKKVLRAGHRYGVAVIPGACTPSEIQEAMELGADAVKLFPASAFGTGYLRAIATALPHIPFIPTGGITVENARSWLDAGAVAVGMGSDLTAGTPAQLRERATRLLAHLAA